MGIQGGEKRQEKGDQSSGDVMVQIQMKGQRAQGETFLPCFLMVHSRFQREKGIATYREEMSDIQFRLPKAGRI